MSQGRAARAYDPAAFTRPLAYRPRAELPYDIGVVTHADVFMLDTTVYVDQRQLVLPPTIQHLLSTATILHSGVACAELSITLGILEPANPTTPGYRDPILRLLDTMPDTAMTQPSASVWMEAGVLAGILARSQGIVGRGKAETAVERCCRKGQQRSLLHDTLIFLSAAEHDAVLVSRNRRHMDLLLQVRPDVRVLLYDRRGDNPQILRPT